ncbi:hypothetical protein [Laspinema olomoucense]|uniref:hypothetical protein n=1 Tax=Laspinema olomoucense TaxID=3231600 RepID=UPI0021BB3716|nr:hypothetical protein [Laspinema sp. D3d]MCT7970921.1 hypothetical protein [Laspinema sp. D3d]
MNYYILTTDSDPIVPLLEALQEYGGYILDAPAIDTHNIAIENGIKEEFLTTYGYKFSGTSGDFFDDVNQLFQALASVQNNSPSSIGGGGTPRRPLAPPLGEPTACRVCGS